MRHILCLPLLAALLIVSAPAISAPKAKVAAKPAHSKTEKQLPIISTKQLKQKLDAHEKVTLVEALEDKYYAQGHLPGAIQMTETDKANKLLPDKKAEIVVYCMNTH